MACLYDLPDEIILHICSYLPSREIIETLLRICHWLHDILNTDWYWRSRYLKLLSGDRQRLILFAGERKMWQLGCIQAEFILAVSMNQAHRILKGAIGNIDCVQIVRYGGGGGGAVVAAGSRDTNIYIWRQRHLGGAGEDGKTAGGRSMRKVTTATLTGHRGWVWSLATDREYRLNLLCSGSWDREVRLWDISSGACITIIRKEHKSAVLGLHLGLPDMLVSACQDKHVRVIDLRAPFSVCAQHKAHQFTVLCVAATCHYIYSGGADKHVCVWDLRNSKLLQKITLTDIVPSLHLDQNMLSLSTSSLVDGVKVHKVHLYDCSKGSLEDLGCFDTGHSQTVTRVLHCLAMIATASKDGSVRLHSLDQTHYLLDKLEKGGMGQATDIDFYKRTLAVSRDRLVEVWQEH